MESTERFTKIQKHSFESIKEIIFELSSKYDDIMMSMRRTEGRMSNVRASSHDSGESHLVPPNHIHFSH